MSTFVGTNDAYNPKLMRGRSLSLLTFWCEGTLIDYRKDIRRVPMHGTFCVVSLYQQVCRANRDQLNVNIRMIRQRRNNIAVRHAIGEASYVLNRYSLREQIDRRPPPVTKCRANSLPPRFDLAPLQ